MSNIKYLIRRQHFLRGHDSLEIDSATGSTIHSIHTDKDEAIAVWKKLVVDAVRENDLYHYDIQDRISEDVLKEADQYLQAQLGTSLFSEYGNLIDYIPHHLNDDATFELAQKLRFLHYQLYEFTDTTYVVWLCDDECLLRFGHPFDPYNFHNDPDYYTSYIGRLVYGTHENFLAENERFSKELIERIKFNGRSNIVEPITEQPELLEQILNSNQTTWVFEKDRRYEDNRGHLKFRFSPKYEEIFPINDLLKEPLFEIRKIDFDTLIELFNQEHEGC